MEDISILIEHVLCEEPECSSQHPNIKAYSVAIRLQNNTIGSIKLHTINKAIMELAGLNRFWEECQMHDEYHMDAKLYKVENFVINESFLPGDDKKVSQAEAVLFIDQVVLQKAFRGRDFGLAAVRMTINALKLPSKTVALLQAGAVGEHVSDDAGEKLTRHWKRLGFREWSYTDESWLLLSLEEADFCK